MRVRRVTVDGIARVAVQHDQSGCWVDIDSAASLFRPSERGPLTTDLLTFLASRERGRDLARGLTERAVADGRALVDTEAQLPFRPASLRCFLGWEQHWVQAARVMVRRNLPAAMPLIRSYEAVSRRTFPALRPGRAFERHPVNYAGNHLAIRADGDSVPWPSYTDLLDYELEFGMIVDRPVRDVSGRSADDAVGGFVVFNDFSARDVQWREERDGNFGPVGKTKSFASSMGSVVVTADEVLSRIDALSGHVIVDGETWSSTSTAGLQYSPGETIEYASRGEDLHPGELLTSGTLPWGSGLELDRWIQPGNSVTLSIELIGSVTNTVEQKRPVA